MMNWRCFARIASLRNFNSAFQPYMELHSDVRSLQKFLPFAAAKFKEKTAVIDSNRSYTYLELLHLSFTVKDLLGKDGGDGQRIAFLTPHDASYIVCQWASWLNKAIAVPLHSKHPLTELEYVLSNCQANTILSVDPHQEMADQLARKLNINHVPLPKELLLHPKPPLGISVDDIDDEEVAKNPAMIVYTSGTTGPPKGVVHNHSALHAQTSCMTEAWKWSDEDVALHVLPLHHVHGIINMLLCPLSVGATVVMEPQFNPKEIWDYFLHNKDAAINVFMAVPTIYAKLIEYFESNKMCEEEAKSKCQDIRLMVSGSASLPTPILERWRNITGHTLLERYGMTEFGMGLTNSYDGRRVPGAVGLPFPGISAKILRTDEHGRIDANKCIVRFDGGQVVDKMPGQEGVDGELLIKSPSMFQGYWGNKGATEESFLDDWFVTGDTASFADDVFRISGRSSVDIIKSGGYKISALDIERLLLHHPSISEVAVVGIPDEIWGQKIAAILKLKAGLEVSEKDLQNWCRGRMANYKIPREMLFVENIPRNAMGKINKKQLIIKYFSDK
ncbi:malonate--CoA ligase ACSF3, mitochondrial-like [Clavelina lepadiformis]|uniref:malonate--CoA ligase ACSF3, mitochondrial-like n=1 Tax=Clavelina lepadiformis TaxID=159417 RepID=UPI00404305A4